MARLNSFRKAALVSMAFAANSAMAGFITDDPNEPLIAPLEAHAAIGQDFVGHNDYINTILRTVLLRGYRCDTISSIERTPAPMSFEIQCNHRRLNYVVGDDPDHPTVTPEQ